MPSFRWGTGHVRIVVFACVWKSENAWGQGGLSKREMDRAEGLKWLTEPVYISNSTLLWEGGRRGKTALQAEQWGIHFSVSSAFQRMLYVPYFLTFLISIILFLYEFMFLPPKLFPKVPWSASSYLHCYLSCPSFLVRGPTRSLSGLLLWHTVEQLERND